MSVNFIKSVNYLNAVNFGAGGVLSLMERFSFFLYLQVLPFTEFYPIKISQVSMSFCLPYRLIYSSSSLHGLNKMPLPFSFVQFHLFLGHPISFMSRGLYSYTITSILLQFIRARCWFQFSLDSSILLFTLYIPSSSWIMSGTGSTHPHGEVG